MFLVSLLKANLVVGVGNRGNSIEKLVDLNFAEGMVGAIPVFNIYENALDYAGGKKHLVIEIWGVENESKPN